MEFMYVGMYAYIWVYSFCMDQYLNIWGECFRKSNCEGEWQDIQATIGKFLFFCFLHMRYWCRNIWWALIWIRTRWNERFLEQIDRWLVQPFWSLLLVTAASCGFPCCWDPLCFVPCSFAWCTEPCCILFSTNIDGCFGQKQGIKKN